MNKAALIEQMAKDTKLPKTACKNCLESFIKTVEGSLKKNNSVVLTGFGTFTVMKRKARTGIVAATYGLLLPEWEELREWLCAWYIHRALRRVHGHGEAAVERTVAIQLRGTICNVVTTCQIVGTLVPPLLRLGLIGRSDCVVVGAVIGIVVAARSNRTRPR